WPMSWATPTGKFRSRSGWAGRRWANIWRGPARLACATAMLPGWGRRRSRLCCSSAPSPRFCAPCPTGQRSRRSCASPEPAVLRPMPDWAEVAAELRKPAVTLQLVWQEYRDRHADGYSYSQFRRHYRAHWKLDAEPRMRRTLLPAQLCEVDYAGMTMTVIAANSERPVSIFVGTLAFSTYIYAEATWTQSAEDWLGSHVRMVGAWGGSVPKLVPDNLKTGVTHASFYDPVLNRSYL